MYEGCMNNGGYMKRYMNKCMKDVWRMNMNNGGYMKRCMNKCMKDV